MSCDPDIIDPDPLFIGDAFARAGTLSGLDTYAGFTGAARIAKAPGFSDDLTFEWDDIVAGVFTISAADTSLWPTGELLLQVTLTTDALEPYSSDIIGITAKKRI